MDSKPWASAGGLSSDMTGLERKMGKELDDRTWALLSTHEKEPVCVSGRYNRGRGRTLLKKG